MGWEKINKCERTCLCKFLSHVIVHFLIAVVSCLIIPSCQQTNKPKWVYDYETKITYFPLCEVMWEFCEITNKIDDNIGSSHYSFNRTLISWIEFHGYNLGILITGWLAQIVNGNSPRTYHYLLSILIRKKEKTKVNSSQVLKRLKMLPVLNLPSVWDDEENLQSLGKELRLEIPF